VVALNALGAAGQLPADADSIAWAQLPLAGRNTAFHGLIQHFRNALRQPEECEGQGQHVEFVRREQEAIRGILQTLEGRWKEDRQQT